MSRLRDLAEQTPPERVRHIDLVRAVAIIAVVLGHWLAAIIVYDDGVLTSITVLEVLDWTHLGTWVLQVVPLFFIVGGYANAASFASHLARGEDSASWLLKRSERLIRPVTVLLVVVGAVGLIAAAAGVDTRQLGITGHGAILPLWFLVVYLIVVLFTPVTYRLHSRFGFAAPAVVLALLIAAGDIARLGFDAEWAAMGNFVFLWVLVHQAGFAWHSGHLRGRARVGIPIAAVGLAAMVVATVVGPYPVSMINVPGADIQNVSPPTLALLAHAAVQLGIALALSGLGERSMQRVRPWGTVILVNTVTFSIFLWHMPALVVTALILDGFGILPTPAIDSAAWLAWRVPWVAMIAVVLIGLLAIFARVERAGDPSSGLSGRLARTVFSGGEPTGGGPVRLVVTVSALTTAIVGMQIIAMGGPQDYGPLPLPTAGVIIWIIAATALWILRLEQANRNT